MRNTGRPRGLVGGTVNHDPVVTGVIFQPHELRALLAKRRRDAEEYLRYFVNRDTLLSSSEADLAAGLVRVGRLRGLVLHRADAYQVPYAEGQFHNDDATGHQVAATRYTVVIPFVGDEALLWMRPDAMTLPASTVGVRDQELLLHHDANPGRNNPAAIRAAFDSLINSIEQGIAQTNRDIEKHNAAIAQWAPRAVAARRATVLADTQTQAAIGFPLKTRLDPAPYVDPIRPRQLVSRPAVPPASPPQVEPFRPEPLLRPADYEEALRVLTHCRNALERSPSTTAKLDEENIRDILLIGLNSRFEGPLRARSSTGRARPTFSSASRTATSSSASASSGTAPASSPTPSTSCSATPPGVIPRPLC